MVIIERSDDVRKILLHVLRGQSGGKYLGRKHAGKVLSKAAHPKLLDLFGKESRSAL